MGISTQHKLSMVRRPRVQITYDVEIGNAIEMKELPFVMGILADLSGKDSGNRQPIKNRKFVEIDRDNFGAIMESIRPHLNLTVDNKLTNDGRKINVDLYFQSMEDFEPLSVVKQIEPLSDLFHSRSLLKDLLTKLDGNDALDDLLKKIMQDSDLLKQLKDELGISDAVAQAPQSGDAAGDDSPAV
ncbi:MAG: type VI secretion system contractile sheath small subunit [Alphaproteobacteria bacterium]|nr:type VI secretion system contractile sheath small subunit [Alphaproteobacteria bacterium]